MPLWIQLTRKLADFLDGVDVSERRVGEVFELPALDAHLLISEGWAEPYIPSRRPGDRHPQRNIRYSSLTEALERVRRLREQSGRRHFAAADRRRAEDRIREELRDERATTVEPIKPVLPDSERR
jgi:hypothetical protein